jgi:ribosomal protein S18 acetylase RimI-like enzyme
MLKYSADASVRKAKVADAGRLCEVFRDSWAFAYRGLIPSLHLESIIRRRSMTWWRSAIRTGDHVLVVEVAGKVAGYATLGRARRKGAHTGEIYELYVDPLYQGLGFGEHLFEACRAHMDQSRWRGMIVWALIDNTSATAFYWRRGGRPVMSIMDRIGGKRLEKVAFVWE